MDKVSRALAILRSKPRSRTVGLDDLILGSMGRTMNGLVGLHKTAGHSFDSVVSLNDDVEVTIDRGMSGAHWRERIVEIVEGAQSIASVHGCDEVSVMKKLLDADGWVINRFTVKTPAWMESHREFSSGYLAEQIEGLSWLERSS